MYVSTLERPQELDQVQLSLESDFRFLINDKSLKIFSTTIKSERFREMSSILSISFSASFLHSPILLYLYHIKISTWIIDEFEFFFSFFLLSSFYRINQSSWWWNVNFRSFILFCMLSAWSEMFRLFTSILRSTKGLHWAAFLIFHFQLRSRSVKLIGEMDQD